MCLQLNTKPSSTASRKVHACKQSRHACICMASRPAWIRNSAGKQNKRPSKNVGSAPDTTTDTDVAIAGDVDQRGTVFGAAALIIGSTIGAGILALPESTHSVGFTPSASLLLGSWVVLVVEALLIAELNVKCHSRVAGCEATADTDRVIPLTEMTRLTVGPVGEASVSLVYLVLSFTLLLAYCARVGGILDPLFQPYIGTTAPVSAVAFSAALGLMKLLGGTSTAERVNSALTVVLVALFLGIVGTGSLQADFSSGLVHADWSSAVPCLPVMFLALVYHDLIPVICHFLGWDRPRIYTSVVAGSLVPLMMFLLWEAVCLALVPFSAEAGHVDPLAVLIGTPGSNVGAAVSVFSVAALATSAIGTTLSLSSFFEAAIAKMVPVKAVDEAPSAPPPSPETAPTAGSDMRAASEGFSMRTLLALCLTLVPPTWASLGNPDAFQSATHAAGAYGMTLLYGLLPPVMWWRTLDKQDDSEPVFLGISKPALAGLMGVSIMLESLQLALDVNLQGGLTRGLPAPMYELAAAGDAFFTERLGQVLMYMSPIAGP